MKHLVQIEQSAENCKTSFLSFESIFNKNTKKILKEIEKHNYVISKIPNKKKRNSIYLDVVNFFLTRDDEYEIISSNKKLDTELKNLIKEINMSFQDYFFDFKSFESLVIKLDLPKMDKRTILFIFKDLEKLNEEIINLSIIFKNFDYNKYLITKKKFESISEFLLKKLYLILNICLEDYKFKKHINLKDLKKLDFNNLEPGDIIIEKKKDFAFTVRGKLISFFLGSDITHSMIVYKKEKYGIYVFEAIGYDGQGTQVIKLKKYNGINYLVLRSKNKLNKEQLKKLDLFVNDRINSKFSELKIYGAVLNRFQNILLKNFPFFRRKPNIFHFSNGMFCSELVSNAYEFMGIKIGNSEDNSLVSPLEILNSPELKLVGYI